MRKLDTVKKSWNSLSRGKKTMIVLGSLIFMSAITGNSNKQSTSQSNISSEQIAVDKEIQNAQKEKELELSRAAEAKKVEEEKKAEEARKAEEAKVAAEKAKKAEEARIAAEEARKAEEARASNCNPNYSGCVPNASDVDCFGGRGNGPEYTGATTVIGYDVYDLDRDGDGYACE